MSQIFLSSIGILLGLFFIYFTVISIKEIESRATFRAFILALILPVPYLLLPYLLGEYTIVYSISLISISLFLGFILVFPVRIKVSRQNEIPLRRYDERDIMFSRKELIPGSKIFENFYKRKPEKKVFDDKFRSKPGLLNKKAILYDPFTFAAAKASFRTVETYYDLLEKKTNSQRNLKINEKEINQFLKKWAQKLGVISIGITELKDYHLYSIKGRRKKYGVPVLLDHKYAIAFTVEMDKIMMDYAPNGPAVMESAQQYLEAGAIAVQIAEFIQELGYEAQAHIDGNYSVVCPLVARDAGLGEIGRMGLLMTPEIGPRVRIGVVTTNLPLSNDSRKFDDTLIDFCELCKKCANACPPKAIPFDDRKLENGINRWKINSESCYTYWCTIGTDCGRCMTVCPYSHPNNFLHNLVRFAIQWSPLFRIFALKMDDFFYGKIPQPKKIKKLNSFDYFE
jgi:reductive dehalogenase